MGFTVRQQPPSTRTTNGALAVPVHFGLKPFSRSLFERAILMYTFPPLIYDKVSAVMMSSALDRDSDAVAIAAKSMWGSAGRFPSVCWAALGHAAAAPRLHLC